VVGSARNDRLRLSVYASKGELSFNNFRIGENMQAKNSSILPTPAKPTAGRRGSAEQGFTAAVHTDVLIRVDDVAANVIETHEHKGEFKRVVSVNAPETKSRHAVKRDG
jgi:hypothetical protein